jgi:hypothetical protein
VYSPSKLTFNSELTPATSAECNDEENAGLSDFAQVHVLSTTTFTATNMVGPVRWQVRDVFLMEDEDNLQFTLKTDIFSFSSRALISFFFVQFSHRKPMSASAPQFASGKRIVWSTIGKYIQTMQLGRLEYLCDRIFYHAYSTCLTIRGLGYEIPSTLS